MYPMDPPYNLKEMSLDEAVHAIAGWRGRVEHFISRIGQAVNAYRSQTGHDPEIILVSPDAYEALRKYHNVEAQEVATEARMFGVPIEPLGTIKDSGWEVYFGYPAVLGG